MIWQNVWFDARPVDGPAIARALHAELATSRWTTSEFDDWPVAGWAIPCRRDDHTLSLVILQADRGSWTVEIAPAYVPGVIGKLRGTAPSARPEDCYELARAVHRFLSGDRRVSGLRWRWGDPSGGPAPPTPKLPRARVVAFREGKR